MFRSIVCAAIAAAFVAFSAPVPAQARMANPELAASTTTTAPAAASLLASARARAASSSLGVAHDPPLPLALSRRFGPND